MTGAELGNILFHKHYDGKINMKFLLSLIDLVNLIVYPKLFPAAGTPQNYIQL
jgi:hypothetical protein